MYIYKYIHKFIHTYIYTYIHTGTMADKWGTATDSQAAFLERVKIITSPGITNEKVVRMYDKWAETYEQVRTIIRRHPPPLTLSGRCNIDMCSSDTSILVWV